MDVDGLTTPEAIDEGFVARVIVDAVPVAVGAEVVVLGGTIGATALNATGALLWEHLDGRVSLGEFADDVSEALDVDAAAVRRELVAFARVLGQAGLLEHVGYPPPDPGEIVTVGSEPPTVLDVGEDIGDVTAYDLDGTARSLREFRGREVLLVHWSPGCPFCTMIADRLAACRPSLAANRVDLVFLAWGGAEANREVFDAAGLETPVALLTDDGGPFTGVGTPAAYHVDDRGRVAAPLAVGAADVPVLAEHLAGLEPTAVPPTAHDHHHHDHGHHLADHDAHNEGARGHGGPGSARHLAVAAGTCAPSGGNAGGASIRTERTRVYRVGDFHVGLGYDSDATADVLDALFAGGAVDDTAAPRSYSLVLPGLGDSPSRPGPNGAAAGQPRPLNVLLQAGRPVVRSRSRARVLRALLWLLSVDVFGPPTDTRRALVHATAALRDGDGLLLQPGIGQSTAQVQARFARARIALADVPFPEVDIAAGELVVPEPRVPHAAEVLERLDRGVHLGSEPAPVLPGRYPLTAWFLPGGDGPRDLTRAEAAAAAFPWVSVAGDPRERVEALGQLFTRARGIGIWYGSPAEIVDAVVSALRTPPVTVQRSE